MTLLMGFKNGGQVEVRPADATKFVKDICESAAAGKDWYAEPLCIVNLRDIAYIVPGAA
jgi:hypothetical protein